MSGAGWLKRRLTGKPTDTIVSGEGSGQAPVDHTDDADQSQAKDLVDQDPEQVPNRVDAPPPPTTEEAGVEDNR